MKKEDGNSPIEVSGEATPSPGWVLGGFDSLPRTMLKIDRFYWCICIASDVEGTMYGPFINQAQAEAEATDNGDCNFAHISVNHYPLDLEWPGINAGRVRSEWRELGLGSVFDIIDRRSRIEAQLQNRFPMIGRDFWNTISRPRIRERAQDLGIILPPVPADFLPSAKELNRD